MIKIKLSGGSLDVIVILTLPTDPWANRAVPRSYSDGAPTSCRVFLVRTLRRVVVCRSNQQTKKAAMTNTIRHIYFFYQYNPSKCPTEQHFS